MELLLVAGALALASQQSAKPVAAKPAAPPPPAAKPPTKPPGYLDACWQYGVTGATVGFAAGPEGALVGGAVGCSFGMAKMWLDS